MFNGQAHFDSWWHLLSAHQELLDELNEIINKLKLEYESKQILPEKSKLFRAFREVKMDDCKYILLGMDPYPNIYKGEP